MIHRCFDVCFSSFIFSVCFVCHIRVFGLFFFFSSRRRHTRCALVTGVQTCALPISNAEVDAIRQQIAHAESGGSRLDQTAARALLILNKANLDARPVCEMVRVRDPAWQPRSEEHTSEL